MDAVEEIKQRLAIEDVIGEYVQLKRAGRNWKGLSPFGSEKSPSFMVSPEKQIWHDFSSGRGGDMISFVMEMEGLDFRGTLELLARKAGIDLEQYQKTGSSRSNAKYKERLHEALELATKFYQLCFSKNPDAYEYVLGKRAFSKETALEWRIGYAPQNGTALVDFLKKRGFKDQEIKDAGLSAQRYRRGVDMFRGRIMIPLADAQGRVIGFTARLLRDDPNAPKYINTPQTQLYDKGRHIYGLHLAKEQIRKTKYVVVAEGNLDVIASHQAGVRNVVATAGTAMTEGHLKALSRFTGDIRLAYDADNAGLNAAERAIPIAGKVGVSLSIVTIPSGKDPDELIRKDKDAWQKVTQHPEYALDWLVERYRSKLDLSTAQGKRQFSDAIFAVVRGLSDKVEQEHYVAKVAELIHVSRDALASKLNEPMPPVRLKQPKIKPVKPTISQKEVIEQSKTQDHLLCLALLQPKLRDILTPIQPELFIRNEARELVAFLRANPDFAGQPQTATQLSGLADYVKILTLQYEGLYQGFDTTELRYEATRLRARLIEQHVKSQKLRLSEELRTADDKKITELLEQVKALDALLKSYQGGA